MKSLIILLIYIQLHRYSANECLQQCFNFQPDIQLLQPLQLKKKCADILFKEAVNHYHSKHYKASESLSSCSYNLEADPAALHNLFSAQIQIDINLFDFHSLIKHGDQLLSLIQSQSTNTNRGELHYLIGSQLTKSGLPDHLELAFTHLKEASVLLAQRSAVLHSLATFQHQYNLSSDSQRFYSAQRLAVQQSCQSNKNNSHHKPTLLRPQSVLLQESNRINTLQSDQRIFSRYKNVIVHGESVTITLQNTNFCTVIFPSASYNELAAVSNKQPHAIGSTNAITLNNDVGFAIPFGWRNFYLALADSLPRALALKGINQILVPSLRSSLVLQELFSTLFFESGSTIVEYDPRMSYYIDVLHSVDWLKDTNQQNEGGMNPRRGIDQPPFSAFKEIQRAMISIKLVPINMLFPATLPMKTFIYIDRDATHGRVLTPHLTSNAIFEMLKSNNQEATKVWNVYIHKSNRSDEKKTLSETIDLFQQADIIMGMHGAGLANILFARKNTYLIELTSDRSFDQPNQNTYTHFKHMSMSLNIKHIAVAVWKTCQFAAIEIARTKHGDVLLSNVLQMVEQVVFDPSLKQNKKVAIQASEIGIDYHQNGDLTAALVMYDIARAIHPYFNHNRSAPAAAVRNTASIAYDKLHVDYAIRELKSLGSTIDRGGKYALALMLRQQIYNKKILQDRKETNLNMNMNVHIPAEKIPTFNYGTLGYQDFIEQYWKKKIPVVFKNASAYLLNQNGLTSKDLIDSQCSQQIVDVLHYINGSTKWASLESKGKTTLVQFLQQKNEENGYVVDFSIGRLCPSLLNKIGFKMSRYVQDVLQNVGSQFRTKKNGINNDDAISKFVDHWPSLFVGSKGTKSGLHIDSLGHFWQLVITGKKRWTIFDRSVHHRLQPDALRRTFLLTGIEEQSKIPRWEIDLEPGDLILVPSRAAHQVLNLGVEDNGIALAGNFVDSQAIEDVMEELRLGEGIAPGYEALLHAFENSGNGLFDDVVVDRDLSFQEFKERW